MKSQAVANPVKALQDYGQAVWLDYIRRSFIVSGELKQMIAQDGLAGVTSNPAIFEKAIGGSTDYAELLADLREQKQLENVAVYEQLALRDIQDAADVLGAVYERTKRRDGYVSLEVSPYLAHDTKRTIDEAKRLWGKVDRENLMIKVPATPEGIPAIETLIADGININVTLLFSQAVYEQVALAYISGLEKLAARGGDVSRVASVASFFISRIDTAVDSQLRERLKAARDASETARLRSLFGKVAIANAKLTYQEYKELFNGDRWKALSDRGAQTQRVLWASTSTKDASYRDVLYCEELIGADTVNTMPPATLEAFRDHGHLRPSLDEDLEGAQDTMETLETVGISMDDVTGGLLHDGVRLFSEAFDRLLSAVASQRKTTTTGVRADRQTYTLSDKQQSLVDRSLDEWQRNGKVRRLWERDATLWTGSDEADWLGWLGVTTGQLAHVQRFQAIAQQAKSGDFSHILLLGMGGSSLGPEVLAMTFGKLKGFPQLLVLDSTDPAQVKSFEEKVDLAKTIFIVASKSGTTLEPNIFERYFFDRVSQVVGKDQAAARFVAITDPGSKLEQLAESKGYRHVFHGLPSIGGRYSILSDFGMAPAAAMGVDVGRFLDRTEQMVVSCSSCVPAKDNPGVVLGTILGVLANEQGRDKVTIIASPAFWDLGAWLEQLLAESTGKLGKGLIPVDREPLGPPEVYGSDRIFLYVRSEAAPDKQQDAAMKALEKAGHPLVRIAVSDPYDLGPEFFRWEIATAVAGSILGINPFNQPDVEASKVATRKLTNEYEPSGRLPAEKPIFEADGVKLFTDPANARALDKGLVNDRSLTGYLRAHLARLGAGDYLALLAYLPMNEAHEQALQQTRLRVRDARRVATCLGFGPRFLHSTGQAYKGGPNSGVFLQITCDDARDLPVPEQKYTFGTVKAAQARGDFEVLAERKRRALRVHLGPDVPAGLAALDAAVEKALG